MKQNQKKIAIVQEGILVTANEWEKPIEIVIQHVKAIHNVVYYMAKKAKQL